MRRVLEGVTMVVGTVPLDRSAERASAVTRAAAMPLPATSPTAICSGSSASLVAGASPSTS